MDGSCIANVPTCLDPHIAALPTLDELAAHFHGSHTKLTQDFRHELGMSIGDYITYFIGYYAQRLLMEDARVTYVARACGYTDDSNFVRFFKSIPVFLLPHLDAGDGRVS